MTFGIGLIGATDIAIRTMLQPSADHQDMRVRAVAASDPGRAQAFALRHGLGRAHLRYADVVADPDIQLVYVSLHNSAHAVWAERAAAAGKYVVVEKPLCLSSDDHAAIERAESRGGGHVLEALPTLGHPWHATVREWIGSGRFGELREVRSEFSFAVPRRGGYRLRQDLGGGCFFDAASYWLQALQDTVGLDGTDGAGRSDFDGPGGVDSTFSASLRLPSGRLARLECSFGPRHVAEHTFLFAEASVRIRGVLLPARGAVPLNLAVRTSAGHTTVTRTAPVSYYHQQFARIRGLMRGDSGHWGAELHASGPRIARMAAIHQEARQRVAPTGPEEERT